MFNGNWTSGMKIDWILIMHAFVNATLVLNANLTNERDKLLLVLINCFNSQFEVSNGQFVKYPDTHISLRYNGNINLFDIHFSTLKCAKSTVIFAVSSAYENLCSMNRNGDTVFLKVVKCGNLNILFDELTGKNSYKCTEI